MISMKIELSEPERLMLKKSLSTRKVYIDTDECKTAADVKEVKAINSLLRKIRVPAEDEAEIKALKAAVQRFLPKSRYAKDVWVDGNKLMIKNYERPVGKFTGMGLRFPGADYPGTDPVLSLSKDFEDELDDQLMSFL